MSRRVTVRVDAELNEHQLAALLWDGVNDEVIPVAPVAITMMLIADVKSTVRRRLRDHGVCSVDCGPSNGETYTARMEQACLATVRRAYGLSGA